MKRTHKLFSLILALMLLLSLLPGSMPSAAADTGTIRIYAIKKVGWENLYIHHWSSNGSETQNRLMTRINDSLYSADIPSNVVGISFNHGDFQYQTGDIKSGITNGAIFTVTGGTGNADAAPAPTYRLSAVMTTKGATVENDVFSLVYTNTLYLEYRLEYVSLVKDMEVKVYDDKGAWYPDQSVDSFLVPATGLYHVIFRPNGDGGADFYHGYFKLIQFVASVTAGGRTDCFADFGEAVEYANTTETNLNTLTLLADVFRNSDIDFQKETTLDLNGHSLTGIGRFHARTDYHDQTYYASNVTITDSSDAGTGRLNCDRILVDSVSEVTVTGGTLASDENQEMELSPAGSPDAIHGTLTVTGSAVLEGTFKNTHYNMPVVITGGATVEGMLQGANFTLTGGYYKEGASPSYIPAEYKLRAPEESDKPGYYQVVPFYPVQIGDTYYHDLASAVTAAEDGDIIRLIDNISANGGNVELKKNITLDLNGYTLKNVDIFRILVKSGGQSFETSTLTIVDSAGGGMLRCNRLLVNSPNTLIIESGTVRHTTDNGTMELSPYGTNLYLSTILVKGTAVLDANVYNGGGDNPITIMENATVNGALSAKSGSGGFRLIGGYYQQEPNSGWIPAEYHAIPPESSDKPGYYRIGDYFPVQNGSRYYHNIASAVDAAQNGDTLKLVEDIDAGDSTVLLHKDLTFDLNGHRLTNVHNLWIDTEGMTPAHITILDSSAAVTGLVESYEIWVSSISRLTVQSGTFRSQSGSNQPLRLRLSGTERDSGLMVFTDTAVLGCDVVSDGYRPVTITGSAMVQGSMSRSYTSGGFTLSGGYYTAQPDAMYVAQGYKAVQLPDGSFAGLWQVVEHPIAQVGQTTYLFFSDAVEAANGARIVLLDNIDDAYTLSIGETLTVARGSYSLTVNPPAGDYLVLEVDTAAQGETPAYTTYTAAAAKAKIGTALYATFAEATSSSQGATVTLLADIADPYTLTAGETLTVAKAGFALTVHAPIGNYILSAVDTPAQGETPAYTTYSSIAAAASVNDTPYATFQQAGDAAHGAVITLFRNITEPYTLDGSETLRVNKNGFTLTVNPPAGSFVKHEETAGDVTTYWLTGAVAQANGSNYDSFPEAVTAANGSAVTLLVDIQEPYTLSEEQTLRVNLNGHALTVNVPANFNLNTTQDGDTTVYSVVKLYAQVDGVQYESFSAAASAANGVKEITLLRDNNVAFSMQSVDYEILRVTENGHNANIVDFHSSETKNGVTYFHKTDKSEGVSGSGFAYIAGGIVVAAGAYAIVCFDQPAGLAAGEISIVMGIDSVMEVEGVSDEMVADDLIEMENPDSQCIQRENLDNGNFRYKSLDIVIINIDTGISFLDTPGLPDWFSSVIDGYEQNTSSIVKIAPPTMKILGYADARVIIPYPKGMFFPPIPYLPDALNPGNHFIAFFEDADVFSFGVPFIGRPIYEEYFEIGALWYPQEAAIVKSDGKLTYYNGFTDACEEANGEVVKILSAPMNTYTLKKTSTTGTATYETLKVMRGQYVGSCVAAPNDLPEGYALRSWTYDWQHTDAGNTVTDTVTCYTVGAEHTVTFQPDNGEEETKKKVFTNQTCTKPADPTKAGYVFGGWFRVTNAQTGATEDAAFNFSTKILSDVTLKAKWLKPTSAAHSLTLDGKIGVNFFFSLPDGFTYTGSKTTFAITHGDCTPEQALVLSGENKTPTDANGNYKFTCYVNSIQMGETITATFSYRDAGGTARTLTDTFRVVDYFTYFDAHQNDPDANGQPIYSQKAKDLIRALKNYGYYVQHFLEPEKSWTFRQDGEPNEAGYAEVVTPYDLLLTKEAVEQDTANVKAFAKQDTVANSGYLDNTFEKITYSLVLDSATTIKVFFKLKAGVTTMPKVRIDSETVPYEPQLVGGRYVVLIENIKAQDLAFQHVITLGSNEATVKVSALSYVCSMLHEVDAYQSETPNTDAWKDGEHLAPPSKWTDAARALYSYWYYASAFVN